jgi:hypothetical protein
MSDGAINKSTIDAAPRGITLSIHSSARLGDLQPAVVADALGRLIQRVTTEHVVDFSPLRLVLVTGELGEEVTRWQRALGMPVSGVSNPPGGTVAGKHMSWGNDRESARSIVILPDHIAGAVALDIQFAIATIVHELGHVNDEFARGLVLGFPESQLPPNLSDWLGLCACVAENTWSEYAAESLGANYMASEDMHHFMLNDRVHLEGVYTRIQQSIGSFKLKQRDFTSLWSAGVTDVFDIFANLGRAAARIPFAGDDEALAQFVDPTGEAANWNPVVERLAHELEALGGKNYADWDSDPFSGLRTVVAAGFEAAGFLPTYDGRNLRVNLR